MITILDQDHIHLSEALSDDRTTTKLGERVVAYDEIKAITGQNGVIAIISNKNEKIIGLLDTDPSALFHWIDQKEFIILQDSVDLQEIVVLVNKNYIKEVYSSMETGNLSFVLEGDDDIEVPYTEINYQAALSLSH